MPASRVNDRSDDPRSHASGHPCRLGRRVLLQAMGALLAASPVRASDAASLAVPPAIGDMYLGPSAAKVTIIEYASASCPNCASFYRGTFQDLKRAYIDTGKIRFVLREYPHNDAALAAFMLARCAPKEKYFDLIDSFFTTQSKWVRSPADGLLNIARDHGLTPAEYQACITDIQIADDIRSIKDKASGLGVRGVPTIFINGQLYDGDRSFEDFQAKLDPLLR
ncbi:MAG: DsbA family protein [Alphaproteobacteria bacterium]|nr:DsbA family protein [Alphaproteobacteria bacterium]